MNFFIKGKLPRWSNWDGKTQDDGHEAPLQNLTTQIDKVMSVFKIITQEYEAKKEFAYGIWVSISLCWKRVGIFHPWLLLSSAMARLAERGKHHVTQEHGGIAARAPSQPITEQYCAPLTNQEPVLLPELISDVTSTHCNKLGPDELCFIQKMK